MPDKFIPFQTAAVATDSAGVFRAKVLQASEKTTTFSPVNPPSANSSQDAGRGASGADSPPKVQVHREGDRICRIEIQCACGQLIEIACQY
jgi:hypothetical protein